MSIRVQSVPEQYYHVYNRGVEKRVIFNSNHDYQRFLLLLLLSNDTKSVDVTNSIRDYSIPKLIQKTRTPLVDIHAFSLLPNHYHLLLSPLEEGSVSKFMQKVATGYTMYFNKKNDRSGALFQGKYKIKHVEDDKYLKYLFEYIHLNPIREEFDSVTPNKIDLLIEKAKNIPWTSLSVYGDREAGRLSDSVINKKLFFELFSSYHKHASSLCNWKKDPHNLEEGSTFFKIEF